MSAEMGIVLLSEMEYLHKKCQGIFDLHIILQLQMMKCTLFYLLSYWKIALLTHGHLCVHSRMKNKM